MKAIIPKEVIESIKRDIIDELDKRKVRLDSEDTAFILDRTQAMIDAQKPHFDNQEIVASILKQAQLTDLERQQAYNKNLIWTKEIRTDFINDILKVVPVPKDGTNGRDGAKGLKGDKYSLSTGDKIEIAESVKLDGLLKEEDFTLRMAGLVDDIKKGKLKSPNRSGGTGKAGILQSLLKSIDSPYFAEGWNDELASFNAGKLTGANQPSFETFIGGIYAYSFSATAMNEIRLSPLHIKHDYKPESHLHMHIHWSPETTHTGVCRWGIEYSIAKGHGQMAFPTPTTIYLEQAGGGVALNHQIIEHSAGITSNIEPDTLIMTRVFRDGAHVNDTFTGKAFGLQMDAHYQVDRICTINKEPNFYGP